MKSSFTSVAVLLALSSPAAADIPVWGQCGVSYFRGRYSPPDHVFAIRLRVKVILKKPPAHPVLVVFSPISVRADCRNK